MAIISYSAVRIGGTTCVTALSDLTGTIFWHWYLNGAFVDTTQTNRKCFVLAEGEQARIAAVDTNDPAFDPLANPPAGWPGRRTIYWIRSIDGDVGTYRIEENRAAAGWVTLATVLHDPERWQYTFTTPVLDDLISYEWRVLPVDLAGNTGTALTLDAETVVRQPDAPDWTLTYDAGTDRVTFAEAA